MIHRGPFITFEGIEGSGKTTQIRLTRQHLEERGIPVVTTEEPGGTALGLRLRDILLNGDPAGIDARAELLLFAAGRAQHVREVIGPALAAGRWVLCDRFSDATVAYQGFGRGFDRRWIARINAFATGGIAPTLTLLFDLPVSRGLERARERIGQRQQDRREDRFEQEALTFHERIRQGYLKLSRKEPRRFAVLDATGTVDDLQDRIRQILVDRRPENQEETRS